MPRRYEMRIKPIKTKKDHAAALKRIETLWNAKPKTRDGDELEVLATLVDAYENTRDPILPPDPVEAIRFRMEQMGLKKKDLAKYLGGRNRVTEILNHTRKLTVDMIRDLSKGLHIPPESLLGY